MQGLTEKQRDVLMYMVEYFSKHDRPPSLRDINKHFGYASTNAARDFIMALCRKGYLSYDFETGYVSFAKKAKEMYGITKREDYYDAVREVMDFCNSYSESWEFKNLTNSKRAAHWLATRVKDIIKNNVETGGV